MIDSTLCYIEKDDCYLMLYRNKKKNDLNAGKWIGVGGKCEPGETPDECICREVKEETGLTLTKYQYRGVINFISEAWEDERIFLYTATDYDGEITSECNEGDLKWIPKTEIMNLSLWEGDRYFLEELLKDKDVNMTLSYDKNDRLVSFEKN